MNEFKKRHEFRIKVEETIHIINENLKEIPVLIGDYGIFCYFENILHMYRICKEYEIVSLVELLISESSFSSLKNILTSNEFQFMNDFTFQKGGITYQFDLLEKYSIDLEKINSERNFDYFLRKGKKIVWEPRELYEYRILNFANFKKVYEIKNDEIMINKLDNFWMECVKIKKEEKSHVFEYRIDENKDIISDYLEIVSGDGALGSLKRVYPDHFKLIMPLTLNIGDISDIDKKKRSWLLENDEDYEIEEYFKELDKLLKRIKKVRIWSSHILADEFLLLCFLCDYIKEKEISLTFASEFSEYTWSIGCLALKEHKLSKEEIAYYQNIWKKVWKENSDIRFMENGKVRSVSFDYFTDLILEIVARYKKISVLKLTGTLMGTRFIESFGSFEYYYMIKRLIDLDYLEIIKDGNEFDIVKYFDGDSFSHSIVRVKEIKK